MRTLKNPPVCSYPKNKATSKQHQLQSQSVDCGIRWRRKSLSQSRLAAFMSSSSPDPGSFVSPDAFAFFPISQAEAKMLRFQRFKSKKTKTGGSETPAGTCDGYLRREAAMQHQGDRDKETPAVGSCTKTNRLHVTGGPRSARLALN